MERGARGRRLLVWDAPNMDMCLSEVIGERPTASTRPDLEAVVRWMRGRALPDDEVEACVFINVPPGFEAAMGSWVVSLRHAGYAVFAKPKRSHKDDVDADILGHVERRFARGSLVELVVASHDAKAFAGPLRRYAKSGVAVMVLGYREKDAFAATSPELIFVDLEDLNGVFARPLPRTNLFDLPTGGRWFEPFPLGPVGGSAPDRAGKGDDPRRGDEHRGEGPEGRHGGAEHRDASAEGRDGADDEDHADTAAGDRADAAGEAPEPGEVLDALADAVAEAIAGGAAGLPLREAGDLLRARFPGHGLEELGFGSFTDLVDLLLDHASLVLVRRPGAGTIIGRPGPGPTPPAGPPTVSARTDPPAAPGPPPPEGGAALTLVSVPEEGPRSPTAPPNPIYQAFGVAGPAGRRSS
jgi:uncharacterized protein